MCAANADCNGKSPASNLPSAYEADQSSIRLSRLPLFGFSSVFFGDRRGLLAVESDDFGLGVVVVFFVAPVDLREVDERLGLTSASSEVREPVLRGLRGERLARSTVVESDDFALLVDFFVELDEDVDLRELVVRLAPAALLLRVVLRRLRCPVKSRNTSRIFLTCARSMPDLATNSSAMPSLSNQPPD